MVKDREKGVKIWQLNKNLPKMTHRFEKQLNTTLTRNTTGLNNNSGIKRALLLNLKKRPRM